MLPALFVEPPSDDDPATVLAGVAAPVEAALTPEEVMSELARAMPETTTTTAAPPVVMRAASAPKPAPRPAPKPAAAPAPKPAPAPAPKPAPAPAPAPAGNTQEGRATWYEQQSGICAHRTLPFGTVVTVTHTGNGRTTTCTVRDRGPFVDGLVIDLAKAQFEDLAPASTGVIPVRLTW